MTISFARRLAAGALAAALACHSAFAADLAAAKKIVTDVCQACHAIDGNSQIAENPKLAGQNPDYLAKALRDYKSGARKNPVMGAMAANLKPEDIQNLAAYFASQPAVVVSRY
jgi:cytochrome c553